MADAPGGEQTRFKLADFEGPLDLLLFLIKKNEINIYDIPIKEITEQYLAYLQMVERVGLEDLSEFYLLAATLLYIKSRMLLPVEIDLEDEADDPRAELVERLIEYQKFKKYSELMGEQEKQAEWTIERTKKQRVLPFPEDDGQWDQIDVWDLLKTFSAMMKNISSERIIDLYEEVSVNEKISLITEYLDKQGDFLFTELILRPSSIMEVICAFLAVLESVKTRRIIIYQNKFFGDIRIKARPPEKGLDHGSAE